jgi:hypothetical protein
VTHNTSEHRFDTVVIGGVGRDAAYVCKHIAARSPRRRVGGRGAHREMVTELKV